MIPIVLLLNLASTWFMCGLIWFVQVVHYPAFCDVGQDAFTRYHRRHTRQTTFVVAGPMLIELLSSVALVAYPGFATLPRWAAWIGLTLVIVIWVATALLQIPQHNALAIAFAPASYRKLCRTNWIRTIAWTTRAALLVYCLSRGRL